MKLTLAAFAAAAALALTSAGALAQHIDVGPGGVGVSGDHHDDRHEVVHEHEQHHDDRPVVRKHHDEGHHETVIEHH